MPILPQEKAAFYSNFKYFDWLYGVTHIRWTIDSYVLQYGQNLYRFHYLPESTCIPFFLSGTEVLRLSSIIWQEKKVRPNRFKSLRPWLAGRPSQRRRAGNAGEPLLMNALQQYEAALARLNDHPQTFLAVLLARDDVELASREMPSRPVELVQWWISMDQQLRQMPRELLIRLPGWRDTVRPAETAWWWFMDLEAEVRKQKADVREQDDDLLWILLAGSLVLLTGALTLEIIKRLWTGASDLTATFGTLFTLLLTGSPFTKRGQEVAQWVFKRIPRLTPRYRAEAMVAMAFIAFTAVLLLWFFGLPGLAIYYSNRGLDELLAGRVTTAQRHFQRAVALNPDQAVAYQNLADVYNRIGLPDEAINWYRQAIAHDLNFGPAYARLSQTYNELGKSEQAVQIALAGLRPENRARQADVALAAEYNLLANLGWAYFEQGKYDQAQAVLEAALTLESELRPLEATRGQLRRALPHYYLAQIYEQRNEPEQAAAQWRETLRFLDADNWDHQGWLEVVQAKLRQP